MARRRTWVLGGLAAFAALCAVGELTHEPPSLRADDGGDESMAALLSAPLPTIGWFGRHNWLVVRQAGEYAFERWEVWQQANASRHAWGHVHRNLMPPLSDVGAGGTRLEWVARGPAVARFIDCLRARAPEYQARDRYRAWPGPNSNTFVDAMLRGCGLGRPMTGTAVGKDWRGWLGASVTRERTGVQLETPLLGLSLGLREGLEVHALGLTLGIDLWPPALVLPAGDGRFGFDP